MQFYSRQALDDEKGDVSVWSDSTTNTFLMVLRQTRDDMSVGFVAGYRVYLLDRTAN